MKICPKCGSNNLVHQLPARASAVPLEYLRCASCGNEFVIDAKKGDGLEPDPSHRPAEKKT